jgi:hypothetical protein
MAESTTVVKTPKVTLVKKGKPQSDAPKGKRAMAQASTKATTNGDKPTVKPVTPPKAVYNLSKLNKEQREFYDSLTAEEKAYWLQNGSLRGIVRKKGLVVSKEDQSTNAEKVASQLKDKTFSLPQARILQVLSQADSPLTRKQLSELTGIDTSWIGDWIGTDQESGVSYIERHGKGVPLVKLKLAKWENVQVENRTIACAVITAAGIAALKKFNAARKEAGQPTTEQMLKDRRKSKK